MVFGSIEGMGTGLGRIFPCRFGIMLGGLASPNKTGLGGSYCIPTPFFLSMPMICMPTKLFVLCGILGGDGGGKIGTGTGTLIGFATAMPRHKEIARRRISFAGRVL